MNSNELTFKEWWEDFFWRRSMPDKIGGMAAIVDLVTYIENELYTESTKLFFIEQMIEQVYKRGEHWRAATCVLHRYPEIFKNISEEKTIELKEIISQLPNDH